MKPCVCKKVSQVIYFNPSVFIVFAGFAKKVFRLETDAVLIPTVMEIFASIRLLYRHDDGSGLFLNIEIGSCARTARQSIAFLTFSAWVIILAVVEVMDVLSTSGHGRLFNPRLSRSVKTVMDLISSLYDSTFLS